MIINLLLGILLLLGIAWITLAIAYLWRLFQDSATQSEKNNPSRKENRQIERSKPSVSQEQIDNARHILVGRSKPFISPSVPDVPAVSPTENPADNPNTFAAENSPVPEETEDTEGTEEDNEMQIDYTMDEPDEDIIAREELQIADAALPEVSPSAILAREVVRVTGWHKNDNTLDEENEAEVQDTLQSIRGTQLMDYIKEATLKQEKDHQKLLAAIRKVEEAELQEDDTATPETDDENDNEGTAEEKPLSYYL
ncbi:hypothetical protein [Porphyromonas endodontalis]|jgi:hypothetical protein|uniref:Conjugal transfer protein n=1 Tax=Porphyromonas endodontalis (strain ATCC 35406 / DSM 24491 / JCM 8526 / CCUG 16442 / BCRC 14492 / NCTC 13058 / HG 370) TaxID=553175 RepID=C3JCN9_POREA|nr:hypothetical protein [Porphyromonas endodontalis]EEN81975.1 hypothetical protein POREN0001_1903 [Porphyromonas endodontalis ATCC 35406]UBH64462.1 hypothetical protein LA319_08035 [Porphyromonas endodontalis]SUB76533.1 Uncharacterised protein [Porphyromonas endodontalis]